MKKYLITLKGISYEVEVEEIKDNSIPVSTPIPVSAPTPVIEKKPVSVQKQAPKASGGKNTITSPMPGNIFKVLVKPGDKVKKGTVLIILEAMKMENEIFASADEVVASVEVAEGVNVNTGDVLITFE